MALLPAYGRDELIEHGDVVQPAANSASRDVPHQRADSSGSGTVATPWARQAGASSAVTQSEGGWPAATSSRVPNSGPGNSS